MKETETNDGKKGGLLKGKPHYDKEGNSLGGIKAIVVDNGKPVELEGGEVIINKEASKKYWKELSKINQSAGNGVPILPPNKYDEDPTEYKDGGKVIDFNPNHVPSKRIINYAKTIKQKHPKIWDLGGNIFGNEAFVNLERVSKRGYWLESEEWMYIKWRSYVARHQYDFRIEGVIAMLKWADIVNKGWAYMKDLIEAKIEKTTKMKKGGQIKKYSFVESKTTDGKKVYKLFDFVPTHKQIFDYYQNGTQKNKQQVTIIDSEIKIETFTDFDSDKFLKQANKVAIKEFNSSIDFNKSDLMFKFDKINLQVYPFEAKLKNGLLVEISAVDGVVFIEQISNKSTQMKQGGEIKLLAPNGKPSNLTAEQYKLVRTPSFKKWFGDWENDPQNASKVIDENGEPLVVYHGTYVENPFYIFDFNKADLGFHFGTQEQAKKRAETKMFFKGYNSTINHFFLNIKTIYEVSDIGDWEYPQRYLDMFMSDNIISETEFKKNNFQFLNYKEDNQKIRNFLIKKYNDKIGFAYNNKYEGKGKSYIVIEPNQIKLADGTNTTFDVKNDDIRFENGGEIEQYKEQGILELNFYPTNSEHAKEYGINAKNPLFIQNLTVKEIDSLKNLDEYAKNNGHDVIFGHIIQKAKYPKDKQKSFFSDVEMIKNWLNNNGYSINQDNNDFHKILTDKQDSVTMDIPLLIRTLELAREDVKSDAELHQVVENLLKLKNKKVLTMDDYEYIAKVKNKHISKMKDGGNVNEAEEKPNFETHLNTYLNNNGIKFEHHNAELEIYNQELELNKLLS